MRLPDATRSRALLVGASRFADPQLPSLPAVRANVTGLASVLTSQAGPALPASHCVSLGDDMTVEQLGRRVEEQADAAEDLLLVYYSGHGLIDDRGELYLAVPNTQVASTRWSAVRMSLLRSVLADARARNRVLILDCCFSGRAIEAMADSGTLVAGATEISGTYTLTATPANSTAAAPVGAEHTAFTGELLRILRDGIDGGPELLTFDAIHAELTHALARRGLPKPQQRGTQLTHRLAIAHNNALGTAHRPAARQPSDVPKRNAAENPFLMPIIDIFTVTGRGTIVVGQIEHGVIRVGATVDIGGRGRAARRSVVMSIETFRKNLDQAKAGDNVGLLLRDVRPEDIEQGMVVADPGTI